MFHIQDAHVGATKIDSHLSSFRQRFLYDLKTEIGRNLFLIITALGAFALAMSLALIINGKISTNIAGFYTSITPSIFMLGYVIVIALIFNITFIKRANRPVHTSGRILWDAARRPRLYVRILVMFYVASLGLVGFNELKILIPQIIPFYLDPALMQVDRWLHFGKLPWEFGWSVTSRPSVLHVLDQLYSIWFFPVVAIWLWAAMDLRRDSWQRQYALSFILIWIIVGTGMALLFSSAGPCFYDLVTGTSGPYQSQIEYLQSLSQSGDPLQATIFQAFLWDVYQGMGSSSNTGISAMPSLHNALCMLFVIWGFRMARWLGAALLVFMVLIFIGSVVLGWHYAVDAYVGWLVAILIWNLSGRLLKLQDRLVSTPKSSVKALSI